MKDNKLNMGDNVHNVLAHSYSLYFMAFLLGLFFNFIYPLKVSDQGFISSVGIVFLLFSTFIIIWAQKTSRNLDVVNINSKSFHKGPYRYTRKPTHWGLFILMLGFGFMVNSFFVVLFTLISFIITDSVFLKKQEAILIKKYGEAYLEYKKLVKF